MNLDEMRILTAIKQTVGDEIVGLMNDENVIELMRNANGTLCIERLGENIEESHIKMTNSMVESFIRLIASINGESCTHTSPSLAVKIPFWNARFQGLIPPVVGAPIFSIRKHSSRIISLEEFVETGVIEDCQYLTLNNAVQTRQNIVISGGTGSGKTTLANALVQKMAMTGDRIITVEDTPEIRLESRNGQQIFTKDRIGYSSQHALKDVLRLRPDRIILGELRDGSCLDLIKAWNTGHAGGLTTVHANSCALAMERIESLILEISLTVPRNLVAQTVNVLVQIDKVNGKRVVSEVKTLVGIDKEGYVFSK